MPSGKKSRFTYNYLKKTSLTEDRTIASPWDVAVAARRAIVSQGDVASVVAAVTAGDESEFEHHVNYQWHDAKPSENFMLAVAMIERERPADLSPSASALVKQHQPRVPVAYNTVEMTSRQAEVLRVARAWLERLNIVISIEVQVVASLGRGVMGMLRNDQIYLPITTLDEGPRATAKTLIEEQVHYQSGAADNTRAMQEAFLHQIIETGEHLIGALEPLNPPRLAAVEPVLDEDLPPAPDLDDEIPF